MRCSQPIVLACVLGLPFSIRAQLAGPAAGNALSGPPNTPVNGPGRNGAPGPPGPSSTTAVSTTLTASVISSIFSTPSSSSTFSSSTGFSSTTNTIESSSDLASTSTIPSSSSTGDSTSAVVATSYKSIASTMNTTISATLSPVLSPATSSPDTSSPDTSSPDTSSSVTSSSAHRNLIIVLSSVLGFVGLLLIAAAIFLTCRFCQGRSPFGHRSATPLDDDEIESWRGTAIDQKHAPPPEPAMLNRRISSIQLTHSPVWTGNDPCTSLRSGLSPPIGVPDTPSFLAKAPNSRAGLTDETVPGADPFIPPMKRQNSRLSKAPPGHARSKSGRSSLSAKSVRSHSNGVGPNTDSRETNDNIPTWFDPEDQVIEHELSRTERTSSTPATSILDGIAGGLSPRPRSQARPWERSGEIGRAIAEHSRD